MTLKECLLLYVQAKKAYLKESTYVRYSNLILNHLNDETGKILISDLTNKTIQEYCDSLISSNDNIMVDDDNNNLQIMTGTQTEITTDTSFTVTYSVKDGDTEVVSAQTLAFKVIIPTLTLSDDEITVKLGKSVQLSFAYTNFGADTDTTITSSIESGYDQIVTTSISGTNLVITSDTEGETIVDLTVTNGQRTLTKSIEVTVQGAAKYNADTYVKLESDAVVEEGTYLLAYESTSTTAFVFNGIDGAKDYTSAPVDSDTIVADGTADAVKLLLTKNSDGTFYIQISGSTNNGQYIGQSTDTNGCHYSVICFYLLIFGFMLKFLQGWSFPGFHFGRPTFFVSSTSSNAFKL